MEKNQQLINVPLDKISPCPYQCRYTYSIENLQQLVQSIKQNGILQPLTATRAEDGYQLISGHRRLLAAQVLKLETVPVVVMEKSREDIAVLCAVENLHREDLNFFEQAMAIKLLIDQLGLTQQQVGERLALTQSAVANKLKLLKLSQQNRDFVLKHSLTERHVRAVLRLPQEKQTKALQHIVKHNLNVAQTDLYIQNLFTARPKRKTIIKIKDVRIFSNTITNALKIMKNAGFAPSFEENITDTAAEYRIVIPLNRQADNRKTDSGSTNKNEHPQTATAAGK